MFTEENNLDTNDGPAQIGANLFCFEVRINEKHHTYLVFKSNRGGATNLHT